MGGNRSGARYVSAIVVFLLVSWQITLRAAPVETNSASAEKAQASDNDAFWAQHVVESYQQLQEQQQSMVREMEQARQEAETATKRNRDELESRLSRIEQSVSSEHDHEIEAMQNSHRFTLIMVGIFAGIAFFGMLFFAVFLLRMMNRRTETMIAQFTGQLLGPGLTPAALGNGDTQVVTVNRVEQSTARFLNTMERLEKRIHDLEGNTEPPEAGLEPSASGKHAEALPDVDGAPEAQPATEEDAALSRAKAEKAEHDARVALLLGKGQSLLSLEQADTALTCFDEVIALDSTNAEAFVKKGMSLERLGKLDEAIDCYDRAIALDNSMTMAYLNKGGVFNRLERYGEALQCYEQALRAQQKPSIA
jgi:tetratricopeptide (TPR) repeat protein